MKRLLLLIIALNILVYSVLLYYGSGTYVSVGYYNGVPVIQYRGSPWGVVLAFIMIIYGFTAYYIATHSRSTPRYILLLGILILILGVVFASMGLIYSGRVRYFYGGYTDAYVLQVEAAKSIVRGLNPYTQNYHDILYRELVGGRIFATATWIYRDSNPPYSGGEVLGFVDVYDYPAAAALYYVPSIILGIPPVVWDGLIYGVGLGLVYYRFRDRFKQLYPLIVLSGGLTLLFIPLIYSCLPGWLTPMIITILYPSNPILSGLLIGWIASYRPYTVVYSLFYIILYWREGYGVRRLLSSSLLSVLAINGYYMVSDPWVFFERVTAPLRYNLYPYEGFGLSSLYYLGIYIPKTVSTILLILVLFTLLFVSYRYYNRVKYLIPLMPYIVLLFYYRPLYGYYLWAPYLALTALMTGLYRGGEPIEEELKGVGGGLIGFIGVVGVLNILLGLSYSGYIEVLGLYPLLDFTTLALTLISPILLSMYSIFSRTIRGSYGFLIMLSGIVVSSMLVIPFYSDQYMVLSDRDQLRPMDNLVYSSSKVLLGGVNPYLSNINVNSSRVLAIYRIGERATGRIVARYPNGFFDKPLYRGGCGLYVNGSNACILEHYIGFPGYIVLMTPAILFGDPRIYTGIVFALFLLYLYRRLDDKIMLLYLFYTGLPFYILSPRTYPVYLWLSMLIILSGVVDDRRVRGVLYGLIITTGLAGVLYVVYRFFLDGFRRDTMVYSVSTLAPYMVFLYPQPLRILSYMFAPYIGFTNIYGFNISYLVSRHIYHSVWPPIHTLLSIPLILVLIVFIARLKDWRDHSGAIYPASPTPHTHLGVITLSTLNLDMIERFKRMGGKSGPAGI